MRLAAAIVLGLLAGCQNGRYIGPTVKVSVGWNGIEASVILLDPIISGGGGGVSAGHVATLHNIASSKNPVSLISK